MFDHLRKRKASQRLQMIGRNHQVEVLIMRNAANTQHLIEVWDLKRGTKRNSLQLANVLTQIDSETGSLSYIPQQNYIHGLQHTVECLYEGYDFKEYGELTWNIQHKNMTAMQQEITFHEQHMEFFFEKLLEQTSA